MTPEEREQERQEQLRQEQLRTEVWLEQEHQKKKAEKKEGFGTKMVKAPWRITKAAGRGVGKVLRGYAEGMDQFGND